MKRRHVIGIGFILVFILIAGVALSSSMTPYVTFDVAKTKNSTVQVNGTLAGDIVTLENGQGITFDLKDENGTKANVFFKGLKQENMEHAEGIVVIGRFDSENDSTFIADRILTKCPSKYESEAGGGS
jgi:cytochrome c-type biogenesis protein CcmE